MTLLELITKASSSVPIPAEQESNYPIVLNPDPIFANLKFDLQEAENPIKKATGWEISQTDSERVELGQKFFKNLKRKLINTNTFGKDEFLAMLYSHMEKIAERVGISVGVGKSGEGYTRTLVEKVGCMFGRDLKGLVLEGCVSLEVWYVLETLISYGNVENSCTSNLVRNLIAKNKPDLIVVCLKQLLDLQTYDLMCVLKYFLVMPADGYESLVSVRKDWESQAMLAIEKASGKGVSKKEKNLAKEAALLVMLAHDGFSVSELCLHYLLASKNLDEVIFSACVGKLNGEEIKALILYLGKWLRKYERFPQVGPCPKGSSALGLKVCDWIPTLENVVKCLSLVVDEHFSSLVLHSEIQEELRSLEGVISSLAAEARLCGTLANLTERLRNDGNDVGAE